MALSGTGQQQPAPTAVRRRWTPDGLAAGAGAAVALAVAALRPLVDIDVFWHVIVGEEILSGTPVAEAGRGWSIAPVPDTWVSTQWLTEVVFALLHRLDGWTGLLWWRYLTVVLVLVVLALTTFRGRSVRAGAWPFLLGACAVAGFAQERSAQVTYVLAPVVGWLMVRAWREGRLPRWWAVALVVVVWANLHGGWVVAALAAAAVAVGRWLDHGLGDRVGRRALLLVPIVVLAACVTPAGPVNVLSAWRFSQAASVSIVEWQPVTPSSLVDGGWLWAATAAVWAVVWAFGRTRPPLSEAFGVLAWLGFGLLAWRNVPVVVLLLAPVLAARLADAWPSATVAAQGGPTRWSTLRPLDRVGLVLAAAAAVVLAPFVGRAGEIPADQPVLLADVIAAMPGPVRVLDDYNVAGVLLWCGGVGHVQVAVDGRTERHGAEYLERYRDLTMLRGDWQRTLAELDPDVAVLANTSPLADELRRQGWTPVAATSAGYLLLVAPGKADVEPVHRAARTAASCTAAAASAARASSGAATAAPTTSLHTSASRSSTSPASARAESAPVTVTGRS